jgi:threonine/homoserine/homoserine lactone efflux protein
MPDTAHLTAFLAAAVVLAAIPGPGMLGGYAAVGDRR